MSSQRALGGLPDNLGSLSTWEREFVNLGEGAYRKHFRHGIVKQNWIYSVPEPDRVWCSSLRFWDWGLEFGVWSLEFGVWGLEFGVWRSKFGV